MVDGVIGWNALATAYLYSCLYVTFLVAIRIPMQAPFARLRTRIPAVRIREDTLREREAR